MIFRIFKKDRKKAPSEILSKAVDASHSPPQPKVKTKVQPQSQAQALPKGRAKLKSQPQGLAQPTPHVEGQRNEINTAEADLKRTTIAIKGDGNIVKFGKSSSANDLKIKIDGNDNTVIVGEKCRIRGMIRVAGNGQTVSVGNFTTFTECYLLAAEGCDIRIGEHCMFSRGIEIRTTDAHSVVDVETGKRTNMPKTVTIGNHVWIAANVFVSKGVVIADDCIIGAGSVVLKSIEESQCVAAGSPAVPIRRGVTWNRAVKPEFSQAELYMWRDQGAASAVAELEDPSDRASTGATNDSGV